MSNDITKGVYNLVAPKYSLIDIGDEFRSIMNQVMEQDGVISQEQEEQLGTLVVATTEKVTGYSGLIKRLQHEADYARKAAKDAQDYAAKNEALIHKLETIAVDAMTKMDLKKIEGLYGTSLSLRQSTSTEVLCEVEQLPFEYQDVKIEARPNKVAIKEALNKGIEIENCRLVKKMNLVIK